MKDDADLIEKLSTTSSSSRDSSDDEGNETVIHKPIAKKRLASTAEEPGSKKPGEVEYLYGQNFYQLRDECLKGDKLFEDPEFPADNDLLRKRSERYIDDVEWVRPHELLRFEEPILVSDRNEGFDIRTSLDSWFIPAFSAVAESDVLLKQVIPYDQGFSSVHKYAGIFRFRFWFGRWIGTRFDALMQHSLTQRFLAEIVVDDRLPVRKNRVVYMRSESETEFWPALLEKAYAKAKGSYELLDRYCTKKEYYCDKPFLCKCTDGYQLMDASS